LRSGRRDGRRGVCFSLTMAVGWAWAGVRVTWRGRGIMLSQRVARWSAITIAALGALRMLLAVREHLGSGSQDAFIAAFTSGLILAGSYGMYRMNRIAASALLLFSTLLVVMAIMDASVGALGVTGVALVAVIVGCGTAAAWTGGGRAKRHVHPDPPHEHVH